MCTHIEVRIKSIKLITNLSFLSSKFTKHTLTHNQTKKSLVIFDFFLWICFLIKTRETNTHTHTQNCGNKKKL